MTVFEKGFIYGMLFNGCLIAAYIGFTHAHPVFFLVMLSAGVIIGFAADAIELDMRSRMAYRTSERGDSRRVVPIKKVQEK